MANNFFPDSMLKGISSEQQDIMYGLFDLALERILKGFYLQLDECGRNKMAQVFSICDKKEKQDFIAKNFPDLMSIFEKETEKLVWNVKKRIIAQ